MICSITSLNLLVIKFFISKGACLEMATINSKIKEFSSVGDRPVRHDGYDKVTGKALYGADVLLPGLLHGKVLRSPHAHPRIKNIDTSKAVAHPDVQAVIEKAMEKIVSAGYATGSTADDNNIGKWTSAGGRLFLCSFQGYIEKGLQNLRDKAKV